METVCLLGPAAVSSAGPAPVPLRLRPKALALLAALALQPGAHPRGQLAELLFPEAQDSRAELRWYLSHLRTALPAGLAAALRAGSELVRFEGATDVAEFRRRGRPDLFRGDLCADIRISVSAGFDTWLCIEQESMRTLFRRDVLELAARTAGRAERERAVALLARLVSVDPYCEDAHVALIEGLEAIGRPDAARQAQERYERIVRDELGTEPRPAGSGRSLPKEDFVPVGGVTLHVVEWAGGEPAVVALHGSAMSAYSLAALAEQVAPGHRFISVDLRGHGLSDKPPSGYSLDTLAGDVAGLIAALGGRPPVLAGFSIGGAVAALAAARRPPAGLILLDAVVGDSALVAGCAGALPALTAGVERRYPGIEDYIAGWSRDDALTKYARLELTPMPDGSFRRRALRAALEEMWSSALETDTLAPLRGLGCPVLVAHAAAPWRDGGSYIPAEAARVQARTPRRGALVTSSDRDHAGLVRSPEPALVEAIRRFLAAVATS